MTYNWHFTLQYRITSITSCLFNDSITICKKTDLKQYKCYAMEYSHAQCMVTQTAEWLGVNSKRTQNIIWGIKNSYLRGEEFLFEGWRIFLGVKNFYLRGEEFFRRMQNIIWKTALNGNKATPPGNWAVFLCNHATALKRFNCQHTGLVALQSLL